MNTTEMSQLIMSSIVMISGLLTDVHSWTSSCIERKALYSGSVCQGGCYFRVLVPRRLKNFHWLEFSTGFYCT
jgi:hypothetical protein